MTLTFDTNLDKPYLATKENKQVFTAYLNSNQTLRKVRTLYYYMRPLFVVEDTAGDVKNDDHMTTMMMMRIELMMMILMTLTRTMTLNQRGTTGRK